MKAIWKNMVVADSDHTVELEGSFYFPPDSVKQDLLQPGTRTSYCPWKGTAQYYSIHIGDEVNLDAVWCYQAPKEYAAAIRGYMAFWQGVELLE